MDSKIALSDKLLFGLLSFMLLFSPLFRAGNLPLPLLILELTALVAFMLWLLRSQQADSPRLAQQVLIFGLLFLPLAGLLPVSWSIWQHLPGREIYAELLGLVGEEQAALKLSVVPVATEMALWALIPPIVMFVAALSLPRDLLMKLVYLMLGMAVFQSTLSLMQFGGGLGGLLLIEHEYRFNAAAGTYINRDHLAGFLEMAFPVALALLSATMGQQHASASGRSTWRKRLGFWGTLQGQQANIYAAVSILVILALVFTRSRMGIALSMLGLLIVLFVFVRRLGGGRQLGTYGTLLAVIVVLTAEIGLAPILDRFSQDPLGDSRFAIYKSSIEGVVDFMPMGSGVGTYPYVYPQYQPESLGGLFVNRAHNDYLEYIFDAGIAAVVLIVAFFLVYLAGWSRLWITGRWRKFRYVQAGAGIGILLIMLHSLVDFNLHKPANAIYFALLLAVFFKPNHEEAEFKKNRHKRVRTKRMRYSTLPAETATHEPRKDVPLQDW